MLFEGRANDNRVWPRQLADLSAAANKTKSEAKRSFPPYNSAIQKGARATANDVIDGSLFSAILTLIAGDGLKKGTTEVLADLTKEPVFGSRSR